MVRYTKGDGSLGPPQGVAARWQPSSEDKPYIELCSLREEETPVGVDLLEEGLGIVAVLVNGEPCAEFEGDHIRVSVPPSEEPRCHSDAAESTCLLTLMAYFAIITRE